MAELVRAAALGGFVETAQSLGCDPNQLLRAVGLSRSMLSDPEASLPAVSVADVLELAAETSGCLSFGLRMSARRALGDLGKISILIAHQQTLGDALDILRHFRARINSTLVLHVETFGDTALLREEFALRVARPARQATDLALGVLFGICCEVLGPDWRPEQICLGYDAPPAADRAFTSRLFQCPLEYGSEMTGILINASDMTRRNPRADPALAHHARSLIDTVMDTRHRSVDEEVEAMVMILLPSGRATLSGCAAALGLNERTLQRQLVDCGTSFSVILNRVRAGQLQRLFVNRKLRLTDIAELLGYASLGAFTRWHLHSCGETPTLARRRALRRPGGAERG